MAKKKRKQTPRTQELGQEASLQRIDTVVIPNAPIPSPSAVSNRSGAQLIQALNALGSASYQFARVQKPATKNDDIEVRGMLARGGKADVTALQQDLKPGGAFFMPVPGAAMVVEREGGGTEQNSGSPADIIFGPGGYVEAAGGDVESGVYAWVNDQAEIVLAGGNASTPAQREAYRNAFIGPAFEAVMEYASGREKTIRESDLGDTIDSLVMGNASISEVRAGLKDKYPGMNRGETEKFFFDAADTALEDGNWAMARTILEGMGPDAERNEDGDLIGTAGVADTAKRAAKLAAVRKGETEEALAKAQDQIGREMYMSPGERNPQQMAETLTPLLVVNGESMANDTTTVTAIGDSMAAWAADQMLGSDDPDIPAIQAEILAMRLVEDSKGNPLIPKGSLAYARLTREAGKLMGSGSDAQTQLNDRRKEELRTASGNGIFPFLDAVQNTDPDTNGAYAWSDGTTEHVHTPEQFEAFLRHTYPLNGYHLVHEYKKLARSPEWKRSDVVVYAAVTDRMMQAPSSEARQEVLDEITLGTESYNEELVVSLGRDGVRELRTLMQDLEDTSSRRNDPEFIRLQTALANEYFSAVGTDVAPWIRDVALESGAAVAQRNMALLRAATARDPKEGYASEYARQMIQMKREWDTYVLTTKETDTDGYIEGRATRLEELREKFTASLLKAAPRYENRPN